MHGRGYLHRDLKPENFLIGLGKKESTVHLIDFGLAKKFLLPITGEHIGFKHTSKFMGAVRYASLNAHMRKEQGRRDDLEAIGFILVYLLKGTLPWQGVVPASGEELEEAVCKRKADTTVTELCKDLPGILVLCYY